LRKVPIAVAALILSLTLPPSADAQGAALSLWAGQGDGAISMNGFVADPALGGTTARVAVGTTVTWTVDSDEAHTVTFLAGGSRPDLIVPQPEDPTMTSMPPMANPQAFFPVPAIGAWDGASYVNSAPMGRGQQFSMTFGKAGTYPYLCLFHLPMSGTIEVVAPGTAGITTQPAVDQLASTHMATAHEDQINQLRATQDHPVGVPNGNGGTTWYVRTGTNWPYGHVDLLQFMAAELNIRRGDTVIWFNANEGVPHTVTFLNGHERLPDFVPTLPDGTTLTLEMLMTMPPPDPSAGPPDPSMLPRLVAGPAIFPAGGPVFDPSAVHNSGFIGYLNPAGIATYSLTFNTPGTFEYLCVLHESNGMVGTVTVS
jgi:plastocyanin